jgi:hypothetical protein
MNAEAPALSSPHEPVVKPVTDHRDWKEFLNFARQVYVNDPHWVEPLRFERRRQWANSHPWFAHAEAQPMLARLDGQVVGTISAQVDRLQPAEQGRKVGYFGQLEAIDSGEVFSALLDAAGDWLKERGCQIMRGPYDLAINQACGLLVEGADSPPMVMMGHAPAWYGPRLEACGLEKAMDLLAYLVEPDFESPAAMTRLQRRMEQRIRFRTMDFSRYDQEVALLRDIFNDAWSDNWGFVPLTQAEFIHMGRELRQIIRPGYTCIAEVDGQPAGFLVGLPNINELIADLGGRLLPFGWARLLWRIKRKRASTARAPLMGVRRTHQRGVMGAAVSFGMIDRVRQALHADGIRAVEMSWILETNQGMNSLIEAMGGRLYKRYRMYQRQLD